MQSLDNPVTDAVFAVGARIRTQEAPAPGGPPGDGSPGDAPSTAPAVSRARLAAAVERMKATGAVSVRVSDHGVRAELPPGSRGTAVLATPRVAGWSCDGEPARSSLGLVAVPLDPGGTTTSVDCSFRPPGLRSGAALGAGSLLVLLAVFLRTRRRGAPRGPRDLPAAGAPELLPVVKSAA